MKNKDKIGRNDPCPCGSGKKYKKCCGSVLPTGLPRGKTANSIRFNKEIAYMGKPGRMREEFCLRYFEHKRKLLEAIDREQKEQAKMRGQTVSCYKGCAFCCYELVEASLGECELIVYYLYHNDEVMTAFLRAFPSWLREVQKHADVFLSIAEARKRVFDSALSKESMRSLGKEAQLYWKLQIPCPFLTDQSCSIYEVRPWACLSVFAVTPSEWCNPANSHEPKVYRTMFPSNIELPFYDKRASLTSPSNNMPDTVYRILIGGLKFLSEVPGLESLFQEALNDDEVKRFVLQHYKR